MGWTGGFDDNSNKLLTYQNNPKLFESISDEWLLYPYTLGAYETTELMMGIEGPYRGKNRLTPVKMTPAELSEQTLTLETAFSYDYNKSDTRYISRGPNGMFICTSRDTEKADSSDWCN